MHPEDVARRLQSGLMRLRSLSEATFIDSCRITRPTAAADAWNASAGTYSPGEAPVIYSGPCMFKNTQANPQAADAGEADWSADLVYVDLPVTSSADVHDDDLVTITSCVNDPGAVDLQVHVVGGHWQTYSKERRLPCRLVTRDA